MLHQVSSCFTWEKKDWVPMWMWNIVAQKHLREVSPAEAKMFQAQYLNSPSWKE